MILSANLILTLSYQFLLPPTVLRIKTNIPKFSIKARLLPAPAFHILFDIGAKCLLTLGGNGVQKVYMITDE